LKNDNEAEVEGRNTNSFKTLLGVRMLSRVPKVKTGVQQHCRIRLEIDKLINRHQRMSK
jgi:hypothetical protein